MIIGCVLGYFVTVTQVNQLIAPEYIAFWTSKNMPVPEPLGFAKSIISSRTPARKDSGLRTVFSAIDSRRAQTAFYRSGQSHPAHGTTL